MSFSRVEDAIQDIRDGKMVIVADDEDRENEGDLVCAASLVTPATINFMATHARGLICLALTAERADELELRQMTDHNTEALTTAFTVSVDAAPKYGVTTADGPAAYRFSSTGRFSPSYPGWRGAPSYAGHP